MHAVTQGLEPACGPPPKALAAGDRQVRLTPGATR